MCHPKTIIQNWHGQEIADHYTNYILCIIVNIYVCVCVWHECDWTHCNISNIILHKKCSPIHFNRRSVAPQIGPFKFIELAKPFPYSIILCVCVFSFLFCFSFRRLLWGMILSMYFDVIFLWLELCKQKQKRSESWNGCQEIKKILWIFNDHPRK